MDAEDRQRAASAKVRVLRFLQEHRIVTNDRLRNPTIGGPRAMGRVWELQKEGHPIETRKLHGALWEVRYDCPALARDASTPVRKNGSALPPIASQAATEPVLFRFW